MAALNPTHDGLVPSFNLPLKKQESFSFPGRNLPRHQLHHHHHSRFLQVPEENITTYEELSIMVKTKSKLSPVSEDARSVYRKEKVSENEKMTEKRDGGRE